jgi:hypothetical protein
MVERIENDELWFYGFMVDYGMKETSGVLSLICIFINPFMFHPMQ